MEGLCGSVGRVKRALGKGWARHFGVGDRWQYYHHWA